MDVKKCNMGKGIEMRKLKKNSNYLNKGQTQFLASSKTTTTAISLVFDIKWKNLNIISICAIKLI